ncbi:MAG: hypothetical protein Kow0026_10100 [Oricola sp.]
MSFFDYAFHHVGCVVRLLRGDPAAFADMDISADGFWRSFEAIPAALPALIFAWVAEAQQIRAAGSPDSVGSLIVRMAALELAFWILPIIVLAIVLRQLRLGHRFSHLIIARNWLAVLTSYVFVAAPLFELAFSGGATSSASVLITLATMVLALWFSVSVTRAALSVQPAIAIAFVAVEVFITYPLAVVAYGAAGLYPPA